MSLLSDSISAPERALLIRERLYAGLASMSVMVVLAADPTHAHAGSAALAVSMAVLALAVAGLFADLSAHTAAYGKFARGAELRHMLAVSTQALAAAVVPLVLILLSALHVLSVRRALEGGILSEIVFLAVVSWLATRRAEIAGLYRLLYVAAEVVVGLAVLGIKVFALH